MSRRTIWALVASGAIILAVILAAYGLPPQEICKAAKNGQESCSLYNLPFFVLIKIVEFIESHDAFFTATATIAIAVFTATLGWSTKKLWTSGERQLTHNEDTAKRELRAYLTLDQFGMDWDKDKEGPNTTARIFAVWKNGGQTPATHQIGDFSWDLFDGGLPADFAFPDTPSDSAGSFVVGPGVDFILAAERLLTLREFVLVADKKKRLFVWSWVEYRDAFKVVRRTEAAAEMQAVLLKSGEHNIRFDSIGRHNAMDGDCVRQPEQG